MKLSKTITHIFSHFLKKLSFFLKKVFSTKKRLSHRKKGYLRMKKRFSQKKTLVYFFVNTHLKEKKRNAFQPTHLRVEWFLPVLKAFHGKVRKHQQYIGAFMVEVRKHQHYRLEVDMTEVKNHKLPWWWNWEVRKQIPTCRWKFMCIQGFICR